MVNSQFNLNKLKDQDLTHIQQLDKIMESKNKDHKDDSVAVTCQELALKSKKNLNLSHKRIQIGRKMMMEDK